MCKKRFLCCFLVLVIMSTMCVVVNASSCDDNAIMPYWVNALTIKNGFIILDGEATVETAYYGKDSAFTSITVEVTLQRKGLIFWSDVDGGEWTTTRTATSGTVSHSLALSKTGEYRAVITCTVYGIAGEPDVVTETLYYTYTN